MFEDKHPIYIQIKGILLHRDDLSTDLWMKKIKLAVGGF